MKPMTAQIARRISDALTSTPRDAIPGLHVTELPPEDGAMQWHLATQLREAGLGRATPAEMPAELREAIDSAANWPATEPAALHVHPESMHDDETYNMHSDPRLDLALRGI
jgi:hypothetical protein